MESQLRSPWSWRRIRDGRWQPCWKEPTGPTILIGSRRSGKHSRVCTLQESLGGKVSGYQIQDLSGHFGIGPVRQMESKSGSHISTGWMDAFVLCA